EAIDPTLSTRRAGLYPLVNFPVGQVTPLHVSSTSRASHATPPPPAGPGSPAPALRPAPGSPARFQLPRWPSGSRDGRPARARLARWPPGSPTRAPARPTAAGGGGGRAGARSGDAATARPPPPSHDTVRTPRGGPTSVGPPRGVLGQRALSTRSPLLRHRKSVRNGSA